MDVRVLELDCRPAAPDHDRFRRIYDAALRRLSADYAASAEARVRESYGLGAGDLPQLELTLSALNVTLAWEGDRPEADVASAWAAAMWRALSEEIAARRLTRKQAGVVAASTRREGGPFLVIDVTLSFAPAAKERQQFVIERHVIRGTSLRAGADPLTAEEQGMLAPLVTAIIAKVPRDRPEVFEDFMPGTSLDASFGLMPQDLMYYRRGRYIPEPPVHAIADAIRTATRGRREQQKQTIRGVTTKELAVLIRRGQLAAQSGIEMVAREEQERGLTELISATLALEWAPDDYWFKRSLSYFNQAEERLKADDLVMTAHYLSFAGQQLTIGHDQWQRYIGAREKGAQRAVIVLGTISAVCAAILAAVGGGAAGLAAAGAATEAGAGTVAAFAAGVAVAALAGGAIGFAFRGTQEIFTEALNDRSIDWAKVGGVAARGAVSGMIDGVAGFLGLKIAGTLPGFKSAAARYALAIPSESVIGGFSAMVQVIVEQWPKPDPHAVAMAGLVGAGLGALAGAWGGRTAGKIVARQAAEQAGARGLAARALLGDTAGEAAARLAIGDVAEKEFVELFLRKNIQNSNAMMPFYRRLGWNGVKSLADRIDPRLFNAIQWSRDETVQRLWSEVVREIKAKHGVTLAAPWVGSPPGGAGYKGAFSDVDLSVKVAPDAAGLTVPRGAMIELEAMNLMNQKLRAVTPTPGLDLDVNVYVQPSALPVADSPQAVAQAERYARLMDFYEVRLGFGHDKTRWVEFRERTLEVARNDPETRYGLMMAEKKYANYEAELKAAADARRKAGAGGDAEELARQDLREQLEQRVRDFLRKNEKLLTEAGPRADAARAEYNALQLEMQARWPEAYVSAAAAKLATSRHLAEAVVSRMTSEELSRVHVSQARFILEWLGHDAGPVVQAWKAGKYQMRDLDLMARMYDDFLPPAEKEWVAFLKQMKKARTPQEAWDLWLQKHHGNEELATSTMKEYLRVLRWETEEFLAAHLSRGAATPRPRPPAPTLPSPPSGPRRPPPGGPGSGGASSASRFRIRDPRIFRNSGRDIVVVETPDGPRAFYKRTGRGGPDQGWAGSGNWVPFDGFLRTTRREWFIKPHSGRMGEAGDEEISRFIAEVWGRGDIHLGADVTDIGALNAWLRSNGVDVGGGYRVGEDLPFDTGNERIVEIP